MASGNDEVVAGQIATLFRVGKTGDLTDGQLLERFSNRQGEEAELAFAALVDRHSPLVVRVCRGVLAHGHDVEDAFQATFLILVQKARTLWVRESLAPWLHRVAYRVASRARSDAVRRQRHERGASQGAAEASSHSRGEYNHEQTQTIHEEINRLPERYRIPVVLCDLEGYTHEQAARCLEWPVGTVKSRQARGRERLRGRLIRRGLAPSVVLMGTRDHLGTASAAISNTLAESTIAAAMRWTRGAGITSIVPAGVVRLTRGVLKTMFLSRIQLVLISASLCGALALGAISLSAGMLNHPGGSDDHPQTRTEALTPKPDSKSIRQVLEEAARAAQSFPDPNSRATALTAITKAQARAGDREGALVSARQAAAAALAMKPDSQCDALVSIAWARAAANDRDGALNVLRLAMRSAATLGTADWRELFLLRMIAASQFDLGDRDAALATSRRMSEIALAKPVRGSDRAAYLSDVVLVQSYLGDFDGAFRTVAAGSEDGQSIQGQLFGVMATGAAAEYAFAGQPHRTLGLEDRGLRRQAMERAIQTVESFECTGERPYATLAISLAKLGDLDRALVLARRIGKPPLTHPHSFDPTLLPWALSVIGAEAAKAGQRDQARERLREVVELLQHAPKLSSRWRLGEIARNQAAGGDIAGAMRTAEAVEPESLVRTLTGIGETQRESGDDTGARATLRIALKKAELQLRTPPQLEGVDSKPAVARAVGKPVPPNIARIALRLRENTLAQIAAIHAKLGVLKSAVETMDQISRDDARGWAARDIAEARTRAGDAEGALAWSLALEPATVRAWALRGLATGALAGR